MTAEDDVVSVHRVFLRSFKSHLVVLFFPLHPFPCHLVHEEQWEVESVMWLTWSRFFTAHFTLRARDAFPETSRLC